MWLLKLLPYPRYSMAGGWSCRDAELIVKVRCLELDGQAAWGRRGFYDPRLPQPRSLCTRRPIRYVCMVKGTEFCCVCSCSLRSDYYKGRNRLSWCLNCFVRMDPREKQRHALVVKARHCNFVHEHIGVPRITIHTQILQQVRQLIRKEKVMWLKYGDSYD